MGARRLERVQELFADAIQRLPADRASYLDEACGNDTELRAEVEDLLAHAASVPPHFLAPPPVPPDLESLLATSTLPDTSAGAQDPLVGERLGRYEVIRVIAAGGMATVYEAVQDRPRRAVALKVLKPHMVTPMVLRRFRLEAEILGHLRHSNIAQVYQAEVVTAPKGMSVWAGSSVAYLAMEYIPGAPTITEYAAAKLLDTRRRLALFLPVCEAVHYGHQKGIIHRDLKPANILVGADGQPKVIDFGIARVTNKDIALTTHATDLGQLIGTVQYMSPEQCAGDPRDVDVRTDVYSLGVVLYELLCGVLPYCATGLSAWEAIRRIQQEQPRLPSAAVSGNIALVRQLRGSLDAIVLKALAKDREQRYGSAADLALDIRRHLQGERVDAHPPSPWASTVRWVIRHPIYTTGAACSLILGLTVVLVLVIAENLALRPDRIQFDEFRKDRATLLTAGNRPLRSWGDGTERAVGMAEVLAPSQAGRQRLAVVGLPASTLESEGPGVCCYDLSRSHHELHWRRVVEDNDIPGALLTDPNRVFASETFGVRSGVVADVFTELPEMEIVVAFGHDDTTQGALHVYDLKGERHYQAWINTLVDSVCWLRDAGVLILAGVNGECFIEDRGLAAGAKRSHPPVVLALRLRRGLDTREYISNESDNPQLRPEWSLCVIAPLDTRVRLYVDCPRETAPGGVRLSVYLPSDYPEALTSLTWLIDSSGEIIRGPRADDTYDRNRKHLPEGDPRKLPPIEAWRLIPLPPCRGQSPGGGATAQFR
ncbi:MAG: serine/threonine protein kinase [Phycisphaerae bacterium]|nr:serine/threonine protein kinase [Phycisphaerae bacterium]